MLLQSRLALLQKRLINMQPSSQRTVWDFVSLPEYIEVQFLSHFTYK